MKSNIHKNKKNNLQNLFKNLFIACLTTLLLVSCGSLTSGTEISGNNNFILGNNPHGKFKVKLKNVSNEVITVLHAPISGGSHSPQVVQPNQTITVHVDKDTALKIENKTNKKVNVDLKVTGDLGLSMGYKN